MSCHVNSMLSQHSRSFHSFTIPYVYFANPIPYTWFWTQRAQTVPSGRPQRDRLEPLRRLASFSGGGSSIDGQLCCLSDDPLPLFSHVQRTRPGPSFHPLPLPWLPGRGGFEALHVLQQNESGQDGQPAGVRGAWWKRGVGGVGTGDMHY